MDLASLAGQLELRITQHDGRVQAVETCLQRPLGAIATLLQGQTPEAAVERVPLLFALCAGAQQVAALRAIEQARGLVAAPGVERGRCQLTELELIRESLLRLTHDWSLPLDTERLRHLIALCQRGILLLAPVMALEAPAFEPCQRLREIQDQLLQDWRDWRSNLPADWLAKRLAPWQAIRLDAQKPAPLAAEDIEPLLTALRTGDVRAQIAGQARITGPAAAGDPLAMAGAQIGQRVDALLQGLGQAIEHLADPPPLPLDLVREAGEGVGLVQTARGWLLHRVVLHDERVACWQILAPTDWNFHPEGLLVQQLPGVELPAGRERALLQDLILSMDPCVAFNIQGLDHA